MDRLQELNNERDAIERQIIEICYEMPAISYDIGWSLSAASRNKIIEVINQKKAEDKPLL